MDFFLVVFQVFLGIVLADVVSGVLHYVQDNVEGDEWPWIGAFFIDGMIHHNNPEKFLDATVWQRSHMPILGAIGVFVLFLPFMITHGFMLWLVVACVAFGSMIEIQVWAHRNPENRPLWVKLMHYTGIMQSPQHHGLHHKENTNYCVITDWCNPSFNWALKRLGLVDG